MMISATMDFDHEHDKELKDTGHE
ncbi:hypothetical protein WH7805_00850 [Synechococcus sp. WH 7805]|nr:hypothetical protein WH7805_00850 [Synechococcus sp. WH 7805]